MAINYDSWNLQNALSTIQGANSVSPTPNYNGVDISNASGMEDLYGINPDEIDQKFGQNFRTGVGAYAPFPGDKSKIDQLQELYGTVGETYDVTDTLAALGSTRRANLLGSEQAANTAARKYEETAPTGSSSGVGASLLRAQALLPALQADTKAAGDERMYADSAKQKALGEASKIATTLAELTQNYTDSLATYNSNKANFGLNYADKRTGQVLQASGQKAANRIDVLKMNAQLAENARQANLAAALQTRGQDMQAAETATNQRIQASESYLKNAEAPTGGWTTDALGHITSGQSAYDQLQNYLHQRSAAEGTLAGIGF